jgi:hypothetical protein
LPAATSGANSSDALLANRILVLLRGCLCQHEQLPAVLHHQPATLELTAHLVLRLISLEHVFGIGRHRLINLDQAVRLPAFQRRSDPYPGLQTKKLASRECD